MNMVTFILNVSEAILQYHRILLREPSQVQSSQQYLLHSAKWVSRDDSEIIGQYLRVQIGKPT